MQGKPKAAFKKQRNPSGQKMDMATVKKLAISTAAAASILLAGASASAQDDARIKQVVKDVTASKAVAKATQAQIEKIDNKTLNLLNRYKTTLKSIEGLKAFNAQQERTIAIQKEKIAKLENSISQVNEVKIQIPGLMEEMIDNLEEFVKSDVPFELETRMERIQVLRDTLVGPDFADPERFRVILEAYKNEASYGNTINAWAGQLADGRNVTFVRIGRLGYYYQTNDGSETKVYDNNSWADVTAEQASQVRNLRRMAAKQAPVDLVALPIKKTAE